MAKVAHINFRLVLRIDYFAEMKLLPMIIYSKVFYNSRQNNLNFCLFALFQLAEYLNQIT